MSDRYEIAFLLGIRCQSFPQRTKYMRCTYISQKLLCQTILINRNATVDAAEDRMIIRSVTEGQA